MVEDYVGLYYPLYIELITIHELGTCPVSFCGVDAFAHENRMPFGSFLH
jgi:hypothetical protein